MDHQDAITRLAHEVDAAYNDGDSARMAAYWTDDGLNINPFGETFEGRASIQADLRDGLNGFMKGSRHELAVSRIYLLNEQTAVADGIATITGIEGFDGNTMEPQTSNFTIICSRDEDGHWRIAQMRAYKFLAKPG